MESVYTFSSFVNQNYIIGSCYPDACSSYSYTTGPDSSGCSNSNTSTCRSYTNSAYANNARAGWSDSCSCLEKCRIRIAKKNVNNWL